MHIVTIASEAVPFAKTGGLADVAGTLPRALAKLGEKGTLILPFYEKHVDAQTFGIDFKDATQTFDITVSMCGAKVRGKVFRLTFQDDLTVLFIAQPAFFDREELYQTASGDYPDNAIRFIFYSRAALEAMVTLKIAPDIIHVHDWQTALIPALLKHAPRMQRAFAASRTLLTIHNLGYQGLFPKSVMPYTGLGWEHFHVDLLEFWGQVNLLKGGLLTADAITTVSPTYAHEILTREQGFGLEGVLAHRQDVLSGILNGLDEKEWNPQDDPHIPAPFSLQDLKGKRRCKAALRSAFQLPEGDDAPIIGIVGRLTSQKGIDLVVDALPELLKLNLQLVILGTGEDRYHKMLTSVLPKAHGRIGLKLGFDNALAHLIEAGSDFFLMPSRYEPCGLNQMISLRYGTIPIVRATGGLDDSIQAYHPKQRTGNGFKFREANPSALVTEVRRALQVYEHPSAWKALITNAMQCDCSWTRSAKHYCDLYRSMISKT